MPATTLPTPVTIELDPFNGTAENQSPPGCDWPPVDADEMIRLDEWCDRMEREAAGRE